MTRKTLQADGSTTEHDIDDLPLQYPTLMQLPGSYPKSLMDRGEVEAERV